MSETSEKTSFSQFAKQTYIDAGRALMLQDDLYVPYLEKKRPFRFGCGTLALLLLPAAIALGIGVVLDLATLPRLDLIQEQLHTIISQSAMYQSLTGQYPTMIVLVDLLFSLAWLVMRFSGVYPYPASIILAPISFITGVLFTWWLFTVLLQMVAGWLGGKAQKGALYAPMVFAFAPQLLNAFGLIPGLSIPLSLMSAWTLAISYQILRATYGFSWGRTVMTIVLTLVMHIVLIALSVIFGVIIGVAVASAMG
jgi:hypothetical protein